MHDYNQKEIDRLRGEYAHRDWDAEAYKYSVFNPATLFSYQTRQAAILRVLFRHGFYPMNDLNILEVGCGTGRVLSEFLTYSADPARLFGVDVIGDWIERAHERLPHLRLIHADGQIMPFSNCSFQIVMQYTAMSSILDAGVRKRMADEMLRVLDSRKGIILLYDFWINTINRQTHGIRPAEIKELFPNCTYEFHRITLAPPITRRLIKISWLLCDLLERTTLLNSHYLTVVRPRA